MVSARSMVMSFSSPRRLAAIRTLRPKGEAGAVRKCIMLPHSRCGRAAGWLRRLPRTMTVLDGLALTGGSPGYHQVDGLRALALLVGFDIEADALPLGQRLQSGTLHRCNMDENVTPPVIRLDETVAALAVEEFDRTGHRQGKPPLPVAPPPAPTARRVGRTFATGKGVGYARRHSVPPAPHGAERQSQQEKLDKCGDAGKGRRALLFASALLAGEPVEV